MCVCVNNLVPNPRHGNHILHDSYISDRVFFPTVVFIFVVLVSNCHALCLPMGYDL
jgi:hypothetical protein